MNRELLLREVRRQGVPALALAGLSLLLELATDAFVRQKGGYVSQVIALLGPYLLGVAAVAPDVESGAESFLARLPLRRWGLFLLRVGVAAGWSLALVLGVLALDHGGALGGRLELLGAGALALAAGLLASCAIRPTLAAFLVGPLLLGVPVGLYQALLVAGLHADVDRGLLTLVTGLVALLAAWLTYARGDLHLPGWRPLRVAAATLGAALGLAYGATTAAWALTEPPLMRQVSLVSRTSEGLVALTAGWVADGAWLTPADGKVRYELIRVGPGGPVRTVRLPGGSQPLSLAPGGERCLAGAWSRGVQSGVYHLSVWDTRSGQLVAEHEESRWAGLAPAKRDLLWALDDAVGWAEGVPWLPLTDRLVGLGPVRAEVALPAGQAWLGFGDGVALHGRGDELWLADLRRPAAAPARIDLGTGLRGAGLCGAFVVAAAVEGEAVSLRWTTRDGASRGSASLPGLRPEPGAALRVRACGAADLVVSWTQRASRRAGQRAGWETSPLLRVPTGGGAPTALCEPAPERWEVVGPGWLCLREGGRPRLVELRPGPVQDGDPPFARVHELRSDWQPVALLGQHEVVLADGRLGELQWQRTRDPLAGWRNEYSR